MAATQYFFIQTALDDRVLDLGTATDGSTAGNPIAVVNPRRTTDNDSQLWLFAPTGHLINKQTGMVLDLYGGLAVDQRPIIVFPGRDGADSNQRWTLSPAGELVSQADTGMVLDVYGAESAPGTRVILFHRKTGANDDRTNQTWRLVRDVSRFADGGGSALQFNGAGQAVQMPAVTLATGDFTVEAWLRSTTGGPVLTAMGRYPTLVFGVLATGALRFGMTRGSARPVPPNVSVNVEFQQTTSVPTGALDGDWHHLAVVRAGTQVQLYLDGVAVAQDPDQSNATPRAPVYPDQSASLYLGVSQQPPIIRQQGAGMAVPIPLDTYQLDGDLDEVRLWSAARTVEELRDGMHHLPDNQDPTLQGRWSFDSGDATDSSSAGRNGTLSGSPVFIPSEVDLVPPGDPYLIAQAKLIQDWVAGNQQVAGYRVLLSLRAADDSALPGYLLVDTDQPATLHLLDGTEVPVGPGTPATLATIGSGQLSFTIPAAGSLSCPVVTVHADFMTPDSRILVSPDRQLHLTMAGLTGNTLLGRDTTGQPLEAVAAGRKTSPLPPGTTPASANAVAAAIANVMSTVVRHDVQDDRPLTRARRVPPTGPAPQPYLAGHLEPEVTQQGYATGSDTVATHLVGAGQRVQRLIVPGQAPAPHWIYDHPNSAYRAMSAAEVADLRSGLTTVTHLDDITRTLQLDSTTFAGEQQARVPRTELPSPDDPRLSERGLSDWVQALSDAAQVVVSTVEVVVTDAGDAVEKAVDTVVVTLVSAAEEAWDFAVQTVEDAVAFVGGLLQKIGAEIEDFIKYMQALFDWDDILVSFDVMSHFLVGSKEFLQLSLVQAADSAVNAIDGFRQRVDTQFDTWRAQLDLTTLSHNGKSASSAPPGDIQSNYLSMRVDHAVNSSGDTEDVPDLPVGDPARKVADQLMTAVHQIAAALPGEIDPSAVTAALGNPSDLVGAGIDLLLQAIKALIDGALVFAEDIVRILQAALEQLIDAIWQIGTTRIELPLVTDFCETVVLRGQGQLTIFNLLALVAAAPFTIAVKLGGHPGPVFTPEDVAAFKLIRPADYRRMLTVDRYDPKASRSRAVGSLSDDGTRQLYAALGSIFCISVFAWGAVSTVSDAMWTMKAATKYSSANTGPPQTKFRSRWSALLLVTQGVCLVTSAPFEPRVKKQADNIAYALWASQAFPLLSNSIAVGLHVSAKKWMEKLPALATAADFYETTGDPYLTGAYGFVTLGVSIALASYRFQDSTDQASRTDAGLELGANLAGALSWAPQFFKPLVFFRNPLFVLSLPLIDAVTYLAVIVLVATRTGINNS